VRAAVVSALTSLHSVDTLWRDFTDRHVTQARLSQSGSLQLLEY